MEKDQSEAEAEAQKNDHKLQAHFFVIVTMQDFYIKKNSSIIFQCMCT